MAKQVQEVKKTQGLIAQAQAKYETVREQIAEYYKKSKKLRNQADELKQSGLTDAQVITKVNQLLDHTERLTSLVDQLDAYEGSWRCNTPSRSFLLYPVYSYYCSLDLDGAEWRNKNHCVLQSVNLKLSR